MVVVTLYLFFVNPDAGKGENLSSGYTLISWNDLGMHCIDHDYSVFAILPPYNNLHAQLVDRKTGKLITGEAVVTYQATRDTHKSINATSRGKTDFWNWVLPIFGVSLPVDIGLAGNHVQSKKPAVLSYDSSQGFWKAEGIPAVPYDDKGKTNCYPMVKVTAKNQRGRILASMRTVLPVSDEMTCVDCHASGTGDPVAQPSPEDRIFEDRLLIGQINT